MTDWDFELGETVYLTTDPDQLERIVTERKEQIGGTLSYGLSTELLLSYHYAVEMGREYDELKALDIREKQRG